MVARPALILPFPKFGVVCFVTCLFFFFFLPLDEVSLVVVTLSAWRERMALFGSCIFIFFPPM